MADAKELERFTHGRTCPICGGSANAPRHQGTRCHGYLQGEWVHCTREEHKGAARFYADSGTFAHKLRGKCPCGVEHAPEEKTQRKQVEAVYSYRDAAGDVVFETVRFKNPKTFAQRRPGIPRPHYNLKGVELVPYQLDFIAHAPVDAPVWIVEGEKDVDRLMSLKLFATCNPMGAGKWRESYSKHLQGRTCRIIADNDDVGRKHARSVARSLQSQAASIRIVDLPGLPDHGDVSDWLDGGGTVDALAKLAEQAPELYGTVIAEEAPQADGTSDAVSPEDAVKLFSQAKLIMKIVEKVEIWKNSSRDCYVSLPVKDGRNHVPVRSEVVYEWLLHQYWTTHKDVPSPDAINAAISLLSARARFDGESLPSWLRVADASTPNSPEPVYFLDLGDEANRGVRISPKGWEVVSDPPIRFIRPRGIKELATPRRDGDLGLIWEFCNVTDQADRRMLLAALTAAMRPIGPYPIIILNGEHGSAKSTTAKVLKRLFDPRNPTIGTLPTEPRDLMVVACSNWFLSFDNVSRFTRSTSDTLCRLATGGGMELRKLKTDDEVTILEATRPIVLNGIDDFSNHQDLMDRAVVVGCPVITDTNRRQEAILWKRFDEKAPELLGALLDVVVGALAALPGIHPPAVPRMAEFAYWGEAVGKHLGWPEGEFIESLMANREAANSAVLEDSAVARNLIRMGQLQGDPWTGLCSDLLSALEAQAGVSSATAPGWPRNPRAFASELTRTSPALRRIGINVEIMSRTKNGRHVRVTWDPSAIGNLGVVRAPSPPGTGAETYTTYTRAENPGAKKPQVDGNKRVPY